MQKSKIAREGHAKNLSSLNEKRAAEVKSKEAPNTEARWTKKKLFEIEVGLFKHLCQAVNTPFSLAQLQKANNGDWLGIAKAPFPDPLSDSFADDYLIQQVMRKNPRIPGTTNRSRKAAAVKTFWKGELQCKETNDLLRLCSGDYATPRTASLAIKPQVLSKIREFISRTLGPLDSECLEFVDANSRFGPGATFHCPSDSLTPSKKLEAVTGFTPSLTCFVQQLVPRGIICCSTGSEEVHGSRASTAPKNFQTDRFIAIEPSQNMRWQLGLGALIKRSLRRVGYDLRYQADINRKIVKLAMKALKATIDLSNASDTIAKHLVQVLFPPRWAHLFNTLRSPEILMPDGKLHPLEKISSMGNGFTFELETLIFLAVCKAYDSDPAVFGDDMIVNQSCAKDVVRTLEVLGFKVNGEKTFMAGVFFESCGSDYWLGRNVRPFFLKKEKHEDLQTAIIRMANAVRRYSHRRNLGYGCDNRFLSAWEYLVSRSPEVLSTAVPEGYGDIGLLRNFDEATPSRLGYGHEGFKATTYFARGSTLDGTEKLSALFAALDKIEATKGRDEQSRDRRLASMNFPDLFERDFLRKDEITGHITAHQYGMSSTRINPLVIEGANWGTGGPTASQTFESVRGRSDKPRRRVLPVQHWLDLGPWC